MHDLSCNFFEWLGQSREALSRGNSFDGGASDELLGIAGGHKPVVRSIRKPRIVWLMTHGCVLALRNKVRKKPTVASSVVLFENQGSSCGW